MSGRFANLSHARLCLLTRLWNVGMSLDTTGETLEYSGSGKLEDTPPPEATRGGGERHVKSALLIIFPKFWRQRKFFFVHIFCIIHTLVLSSVTLLCLLFCSLGLDGGIRQS